VNLAAICAPERRTAVQGEQVRSLRAGTQALRADPSALREQNARLEERQRRLEEAASPRR
jgi:hypothetical protein